MRDVNTKILPVLVSLRCNKEILEDPGEIFVLVSLRCNTDDIYMLMGRIEF